MTEVATVYDSFIADIFTYEDELFHNTDLDFENNDLIYQEENK